ncbi:MAG: hypothetical protein KC445_11965 [Anaerolineales bacterium]|nr:hypothetical protein [Anaerolineales bacterium]
MEDNFGLFFSVFVLAAVSWTVPFLVQKTSNRQKSNASHINLRGPLMWLFGLSSVKHRLYIGPGIIQVWSIVYLVVGIISASLWGREGVKNATFIVYLGGAIVLAVFGWILIFLRQRK